MRIALGGIGTRGDVQPMAALGLELARRGHEVLLFGPRGHAEWISKLGLAFAPVGRNLQALIHEHPEVLRNPARIVRLLAETVEEQFDDLAPVLEGAAFVLGGGMQIASASVAEKLGIPCVYVAYAPTFLRSRHHPPVSLPWVGGPGWLNSACWSALDLLAGPMRRAINARRAALNLAPIDDVYSLVFEPGLTWVAADAELAPLAPDVTGRAISVGSWPLPDGDAPLDPRLTAFIEAGSSPVYVGFGSMPADPARTARIAAAAVERAGCRAILAGATGLELPPSCFAVGAVPHGALFPRLAAVVHHGGAGTFAAAARAGAPQIVVCHGFDQPYWAHRARALGVAPEPLPASRLSVDRLAERLARVLSDGTLKENARALAARLRATDAVALAADRVERLVIGSC